MVKITQLHAPCKKLLLSGGAVMLSLINCFYSIIDDVRLLGCLLSQNCPNSMVTIITHKVERKGLIKQLDDGGGVESLFYLVKRFKTLINKNKWNIFGQKQSERLNDFKEILDKTTVETPMSKVASHLFDAGGGW